MPEGIVRNGEIYIHNLDIPEYTHCNRMNHEPGRKRKLLLQKAEIDRITVKIKEKGQSLI